MFNNFTRLTIPHRQPHTQGGRRAWCEAVSILVIFENLSGFVNISIYFSPLLIVVRTALDVQQL